MTLLSVKEVAERLNYSPKKIRSMISSGELPAFRIGGDYRIEEDDLCRTIENSRVIV